MLALETVAFLRSAEGERALRAAEDLDLDGPSFLRELTSLRRRLAPARAAAVLEQTALRRKAATKFARAARMLFTAEGLEQASGEAVAERSAARYEQYSRVADCCCGIGGDLLALARRTRVDAYELDPVRLACAKHNATACGLSDRISFHLADVTNMSPPPVEAIFFDPGRRDGGKRIFTLAGYRPPVSLVERWLPTVAAIGVKVAPGVAHDEVVWQCEQEFVAEGQDLKECLLWFGPLATASCRATVLPAGVTLESAPGTTRATVGEPLTWLYDPSPAVTRAGLIGELATLLAARQLDPALAYLTGHDLVQTPFARAYRIEAWMPFNLRKLKAHLRALGVGRVTVRRRGAPVDPELLERRLRQDGAEARSLFLTRMRGRPIAVICDERLATPSARAGRVPD